MSIDVDGRLTRIRTLRSTAQREREYEQLVQDLAGFLYEPPDRKAEYVAAARDRWPREWQLTPQCALALGLLYEAAGRTVTNQALGERIRRTSRDPDHIMGQKQIQVIISQLRKALADVLAPDCILGSYNVGYTLSDAAVAMLRSHERTASPQARQPASRRTARKGAAR